MKKLTLANLRQIASALKRDAKDGYYFTILRPDTHYALKVLTARTKYRHERWIPRWEKWSGRKYVEIKGEFGYW